MGKKCLFNSYEKLGGTPIWVAPGSYEVDVKMGTDINNYKFDNSPRFIFGTSKKEDIKCSTFELGDRYLKYSAFGEQIMSPKDSRPGYSFGKMNRFGFIKRSANNTNN